MDKPGIVAVLLHIPLFSSVTSSEALGNPYFLFLAWLPYLESFSRSDRGVRPRSVLGRRSVT
ncbi:hypothetical protein J6590_025550 [Homalodisca vitripennis]|nr:hypothetical protein J6590_025550 [Homalodisca vitripennis]